MSEKETDRELELRIAEPFFGGSGMKKHEFEFRIEVSPLDEALPCAHCDTTNCVWCMNTQAPHGNADSGVHPAKSIRPFRSCDD